MDNLSVWSVSLTVFMLIDPIGSVPIVLGVMENVPQEKKLKVLLRECFFALAALMICLFAGKHIMSFFGLTDYYLGIAGGIVLFLIGIRIIFVGGRSVFTDTGNFGEPFIVPIAIPSLVGPSVISMLILFTSREPERMGFWTLSVLLAWVGATVITLLSGKILKALGQRTIGAIDRLMGMLLTALSVQMFGEGLRKYMEHFL